MKSVALIACVLLVAGCGSDKDESLPPACSEGFGAVVKALQKAPGRVLIDGITPISKCFNVGASGDDIQIVGSSLLPAAQQFGDKARSGDQDAALRLGYLIGAVDKGSKRSGLGDEMRRRIESEAEDLGATQAAYQRGLRAGSEQG